MNRKVSIAPMMDCTDRHERFFLRLISKNVHLYTEMIVDEAINRGDKKKLLEFNWVTLSLATKTNWYGLSTFSIQSSTVTLAMRGVYTWNFVKSRDFYKIIGFSVFLIRKSETKEIEM